MLMPAIFGENLLDSFFDDDFMKPVLRNRRVSTPASAVMKTDIKEKEDSFELAIDLPGYKKEDVTAELKDGYLTISAKTNTSNDEKDEDGHYIRRERYYGSCSRSFYVGEHLDQEDIKAKFTDGILTVLVPKKEARPQIEENKYIMIE